MQRCQGLTKKGTKCKRNTSCCRWHRVETCPVCIEDISVKQLHTTSCGHSFHKPCISTWFETSDECPICRTVQDDDPLIMFKRNIRERMENIYMDAIHSLEDQVRRLRRPRARRID